MIRRARLVLPAAVLTVLPGSGLSAASASGWGSSGQWATWANAEYTLYNDVWGGGAGSQSIWADSYSNWGVWADHPDTAGVKAYPNISHHIGRRLSALSSVTSSFSVTAPSAGAYATAYDVWSADNAYEIMLRMNRVGGVGPLGSYQTSVAAGGHSWSVYRGSNGSNQVFSFVRSGNTSSGSVDVKAVLDWIRGDQGSGLVRRHHPRERSVRVRDRLVQWGEWTSSRTVSPCRRVDRVGRVGSRSGPNDRVL